MRWTLVLAALLLLVPLAEAGPSIRSGGQFTLVGGQSQTFTLTVESAQKVQVSLVFDAGVARGLHVLGPKACSDPDIFASGAGHATMGFSSCGVLQAGKYHITLKLDAGAVRGTLVAYGARLA